MTYPLYILLGLAPSLIWLFYFLRKDVHPESSKMILKIFFWGAAITLVAALIEIGFQRFVFEPAESWPGIPPLLASILYHLIGIALIEEALKYLVVRQKVLNDPEFDEPVDAMLYMIIAALGFAALENILVLLSGGGTFLFGQTILTITIRFLGATFLHALCSAMVGYFLALSLFQTKKRTGLIISGLGIATALHAFFNLSIMKAEEAFYFILIPIIILICLAIFVSFGFRKLKKLASVCKIK